MSAIRIRRRATTPKGFLRRIRDMKFGRVKDPRERRRIKHPLDGALQLGIVSLATKTSSTRGVEKRSTQLADGVKGGVNLDGRISDNAFGALLPRLGPTDLQKCIHRQVKEEWTRKNLRPTRLKVSTGAVDGKHLTTLTEEQVRDLVTRDTPLDGSNLSVQQLREVVGTQFPEVQIHDRETGLVGLVRVHRVTLISSEGAVVIHQQLITGATNEWGTIEKTLRAVHKAYGRTGIVEMVTMDAGNTCKKVASLLTKKNTGYFLALKGKQGEIYEEATDRLGSLTNADADWAETDDVNGETRVHSVWTTEIPDGLHGWQGTSQLVRVERITLDNEGNRSVGNRYFLTSAGPGDMSSEDAAKLARAHWRCENDGHWTYDSIWDEDARRTPWTTDPTGVVNVGMLRVLAINIMVMLRALSRGGKGDDLETPTWDDVIEHARFALLKTSLDTSAFDAFED